jgi:hypothetical protein
VTFQFLGKEELRAKDEAGLLGQYVQLLIVILYPRAKLYSTQKKYETLEIVGDP